MDIDKLIMNHTGTKTLPRQSIYMKQYESWYKGKVKNIHNYHIYNGENTIAMEMRSMQMAKYACETWADLLMNEKCSINIPEDKQPQLDKILTNNNFWVIANKGTEKDFALGYGVLVVTIDGIEVGDKGTIKKDKASIGIKHIDGLRTRPITVENGIITECAFESINSDNTVVVIHLKNDKGEYVIHNYKVYKDDTMDYYTFNTKSRIPFFQIIQPNIANNLNDELVTDELAISVFGNSIDTLIDLDTKYDEFYNEGVLGRRKIFIGEKGYKVDMETGAPIKSFDAMSTQYYFVNQDNEGKPIIQSEASSLRYEQQIAGINAQLNYFGMKLGFGQNYFRFDGQSVMTATQVISENSSMYRRIKKHQMVLRTVLFNLTKVITHASNEFTNEPIGDIKDDEIVIQFDDSVIEDTGTEKARDKEDVTAGLMSREEYRMKWYGEDADTAQESVRTYFLNEIIDDYTPALTQGAMTPEQFVNKVYGENVDNKEQIIAYITNFLNQGNFQDFNDMEFGSEGSTFTVIATNQGGEEETLEISAMSEEEAINQVLDSLDVSRENIKSVVKQ